MMESSTLPPSSKKRGFPGESPSSAFEDVQISSEEKEETSSDFPATDTNLYNDGSKSVDTDDPNSNLFSGEDECTYCDEFPLNKDHENTLLNSSKFDHLDIPPGIEANFPWLAGGPRISSTNRTPPASPSVNIIRTPPGSPSVNIEPNKITQPIPNPFSSHSSIKRLKFYKRPEPTIHPNSQINSSGAARSVSGMGKEIHGMRSHDMPNWKYYLPTNIVKPSGFMNGCGLVPGALDFSSNQKGEPSGDPKVVDEVSRNFELFKKFDTVADCSDHYFANYDLSNQEKPSSNWPKRIQDEWKILEKDLPDTIFVRVYESRMDLLRAVIVGAEGTPYHSGLFCCDVLFTGSYPYSPPEVYLHANGFPLHPDLYECGKLCMYLLSNTWSSKDSTMLQVLVSIQVLILNASPYFNHPFMNEGMDSDEMAEEKSLRYNETTFIYNLKQMAITIRSPPKHFEAFVVGYFLKHGRDILSSCKAYLDGAQVGSLVRGGVQDVDGSDKRCSKEFRRTLSNFLPVLINRLLHIGAKDCEDFIYLDPNHLEFAANRCSSLPPVPYVKKPTKEGLVKRF